jgi:drug/metabolite transporter (DMT)-like permease
VKIEARTIVVLLFLGFVWGSAFILMKKGLESFSALQVASLRLVFAGSVAVFFFVREFRGLKKLDWMYLALSGTIGNLIPAYLFASAGTEIPSSLSGALNAMTPFFTLIFGVLIFSQLFKIRQVVGITIGLAGALILILSKSKGVIAFETSYFWPCSKVILAALLYGINVNIIKSKLHHLSPIVNSMVPLTLISIPALIIGISTHTFEAAIRPESLHSLLYIVILGVVGSAASLIVFNQLVKKTTALFAASVTYLIPVFAYMWGIFIGEPIGLFQFAGMALILGGITLTRK